MTSSDDVRKIVNFLESAVQGIKSAKKQRLKDHSPNSLWNELTSINKAKQATGNRLLLNQKLNWLSHDKLKIEADSTKAIYEKISELLNKESIVFELKKEDKDIHSLQRYADANLKQSKNFRELVDEHELLVNSALRGENIDLKELERVEHLLCFDFHLFTEKTAASALSGSEKIKQWFNSLERQEPSSRTAMLAALILSIAKRP